MKYLKALAYFIFLVLQAILYKWIIYVINLIKWLLEIIKRWFEKRKLPRYLKKSSQQQCIKVSDPAYKRPDPLIYDQYYLMSQGLAVTWDNPDITLFKGGVEVINNVLVPDTEYEIVARIWNNSFEAPIVDLPVNFSFLSFGIGTTSHFIDNTKINLGVKGGINHPAFAKIKWKTPALAGHYCIQVSFYWADDLNPNNNLGQENITVSTMHSPATFTFQLHNNTNNVQRYHFEADTYTIPTPRDCTEQRDKKNIQRYTRQMPGTVNEVDPVHNRNNYPLPADWEINFDPSMPELMPDEEITINVKVTAPDSFHGSKQINIHGFNQSGLSGGISVQVIHN